MKLSQPQQQAVLNHLQQKAQARCSFCGANSWTVNEDVVAIPALVQTPDSVAAPAVLVSCNNCGLDLLFSTQTMGLHAGGS
jgi:hypothetical protein